MASPSVVPTSGRWGVLIWISLFHSPLCSIVSSSSLIQAWIFPYAIGVSASIVHWCDNYEVGQGKIDDGVKPGKAERTGQQKGKKAELASDNASTGSFQVVCFAA